MRVGPQLPIEAARRTTTCAGPMRFIITMLLVAATSSAQGAPPTRDELLDFCLRPADDRLESDAARLALLFPNPEDIDSALAALQRPIPEVRAGHRSLRVGAITPSVFAGVVVPKRPPPEAGYPMVVTFSSQVRGGADELNIRTRDGGWLDAGWVVATAVVVREPQEPQPWELRGRHVPLQSSVIARVATEVAIDRDRVVMLWSALPSPGRDRPVPAASSPVFDPTPLAALILSLPGSRPPPPLLGGLPRWQHRTLILHHAPSPAEEVRRLEVEIAHHARALSLQSASLPDPWLEDPQFPPPAIATQEPLPSLRRPAMAADFWADLSDVLPRHERFERAIGLSPLRFRAKFSSRELDLESPDLPDQATPQLAIYWEPGVEKVAITWNGRPLGEHGVRRDGVAKLLAARHSLLTGRRFDGIIVLGP